MEKPAVEKPVIEKPAISPAAVPPAAPAKGRNAAQQDQPLREQTIYIPYTKLRNTFEKEGRGVFLPYEQFQELWRQARQAQQPEPDKRPPFGVVVTDMESEATVERDVVVVRARLKLEALGEGWHEVPLRLADAALRVAKLGDDPARIVHDPKTGYQLLVKNESQEAKSYELTLEYARAFDKSPGLNSVQFAAPQVPINRWRIRIPQKGVKISVQPMIASTEVPAAEPMAPMPPAPPVEETVLLAFVGAAPEVRIDWTPKAEGATGLEALATVQAQQEITLEEGVLRTKTRLTYEISRAELAQLLVEIPASQKVTGVFDANVRQWEVKPQGDLQLLTIQLFEPAKKSQNVLIELERFSDDLIMNEVPAPVVRAEGVARQQGVVVVRVGEELRAEPVRRTGLLQLDAAELPPPLQAGTWSFAYRYATLPFELALRVEKVKPRVRTDELIELFLEPEQATASMLVVFDIQQAGVFQLEFDVPAGYEVRQVRGQAAAGAEAAAVDSHSLQGENNRRLRVNLSRRAMGRVGLLLELYQRLNDPNLVSPTGQSSNLAWPVPRTAMTLEATQGRLVLYAPESLRITPDKQAGVRAVSFREAMAGLESQRQNRFPLLRESLAFVYTRDPVDVSIVVERRKPQVDVRQLLTARIESGVVKYDATFYFDVQYSSVKTLRIDVPTPLAGDIRNVTQGVRDKVIDPRPADAAEGFTPWELTGEREFLGPVVIKLTWEQKSAELAIGKSMDYVLPVLKPKQVDRAWGQIVIAKAETLDVHAKSGFTGLRPIDPQHDLMEGVRIADAARAFEFHEDWTLSMTATRYELEDVKRTSIERAVLRMVVTRSGHISVQALYRVRSAVQRLLVNLPRDRQFDMDSFRINGRAVALERSGEEEMYIPLVNQSPEQPFVVEMRYTVPANQLQLDLPVFPAQPPIQSEPAVQKVHLLVYLPEDLALLGSRGHWTSEQRTLYRRLQGLSGGQDSRQLVGWVSEGISLQNNPHDSFATDGRMYAFSTLHPLPPPSGSLTLVTCPERLLNLALFGGLAIVGLVFVRRPMAFKLAVLGVLITALVLAGVFAPAFATRILDFSLVLALVLVVVLWLLAALGAWIRSAAASRRRAVPRAPAARQPARKTPAARSAPQAAQDVKQSTLEGTPVDIHKTVDADTADAGQGDAGKADAEKTGSPFAADKPEATDKGSEGEANHG